MKSLLNNRLVYAFFARVSQNAYLNGLCNVFVMLLPVSLLSAFSMLVGNGVSLLGYQEFAERILFVSTLVWKMFPILLLIYFAQFLGRLHKLSLTTIITPSLLIYVILCNEWGLLHPGSILPSNYPLAILTPFVIAHTVRNLLQRRWIIQSELPNVVDQSLNLVIGTLLLVLVYVAAGYLLGYWVQTSSFVQGFLPTLDTGSLADAVWYELVRNLFWSIGINGHIIFSPYKAELYALTQSSFEMHEQLGSPIPILTSNFYDIYAGIGGAGNTLSLVICMLIFARNKGYRTLALAALTLSVFNINEPILFGLPVIFNPVLLLPFILVPILGILLAYWAISLGLVEPVSQFISWMTPAFFSGYLATGGDINASFLQLVIVTAGVFVYMPFFRQMDQVVGSYGVFSKGPSDEFFNYEEVGINRNITGLFPHMSSNLAAQKAISELQRSGDFVLFYQPQYDTACGCVSSLEVLIRHRSHQGVVTPPTFLTHFAQLGLTAELDLWVIKQALLEVSPLAHNQRFKVSINVSPDTVLIPGFAQTVMNLIESSALDFHQVELEITEELLIQDETTTWNVLQQLRSVGIQIALDDFGSGYSSIGYLNKFDFDKVKIDRSLLLNLTQKNGREMFRLTSELVRTMGAAIVVEGVESEEQLAFVNQQNIHLVQGYLFYKPMSFNDVFEQVEFCTRR
ncbi:EAL domain-containing protein [Vibrio sinaloensis]|uniref:EAL domain-containing protein n=1 Tax=Photobacterium sp. (strain ATCC 43367) TaxID=379097 RepID=UPI0035E6F938